MTLDSLHVGGLVDGVGVALHGLLEAAEGQLSLQELPALGSLSTPGPMPSKQ